MDCPNSSEGNASSESDSPNTALLRPDLRATMSAYRRPEVLEAAAAAIHAEALALWARQQAGLSAQAHFGAAADAAWRRFRSLVDDCRPDAPRGINVCRTGRSDR